MRQLLLALVLALLPVVAFADLLVFKPVACGKGYAGPVLVEVTWQNGTKRDVTAATGTLTVYKIAPTNGTGGTVLFTTVLTGGSTGLTGTVSSSDTALPGTFYAEAAVVEGAVTDTWHGTWVTEGR